MVPVFNLLCRGKNGKSNYEKKSFFNAFYPDNSGYWPDKFVCKTDFLPLKWTKTHLSWKASNGLFRVNVRVRLKKVHKHTAGKFFMPTFVWSLCTVFLKKIQPPVRFRSGKHFFVAPLPLCCGAARRRPGACRIREMGVTPPKKYESYLHHDFTFTEELQLSHGCLWKRFLPPWYMGVFRCKWRFKISCGPLPTDT